MLYYWLAIFIQPSLLYAFTLSLFLSSDYYSSWLALGILRLNGLKTIIYWVLLTFCLVNGGIVTMLISFKALIAITLVVGNIVHVYLCSFIVILLPVTFNLLFFGFSLLSYLLYLFLTSIEFFLSLLFLLESISNLFQTITLANRLTINMVAGSLLTFLLGNSINLQYMR